MKKLKSTELRHGMKVSCILHKTNIKDGMLCLENGKWYICQNYIEGFDCKNKFGYKYSWELFEEKEKYLLENKNNQFIEIFSSFSFLKEKLQILKKELQR